MGQRQTSRLDSFSVRTTYAARTVFTMLTVLYFVVTILIVWCLALSSALVHLTKKLDALTWDVHHTKQRINRAHDVYVRGQQRPPTLHDTEGRVH